MDGDALLDVMLATGPLLIPAVPGVLVALAPARRAVVERFAERYQVSVTVDNGRYLLQRLGRGRRYRGIGWAIGWCLGMVVDNATVTGIDPVGQDVTWGAAGMFMGYLLGGIAAQVVPGPEPFGPRRALLVERRPARYVTRAARSAPIALAAVAALLLLGYPVQRQAASIGRFAAGTLALVCAGTVWWAQRQIAVRAQPVTEPDLIEVDDAVRARDAQRVSGAGIAVACVALSEGLAGWPSSSPLAGIAGFGSFALGWLALAAWFRLRVARPVRVEPQVRVDAAPGSVGSA